MKKYIIRKVNGIGFVRDQGETTTRAYMCNLFSTYEEAKEVLETDWNDGTWEIVEAAV